MLSEGDTAPANIDDIGWAGGFWNNGIAHSFFSKPVTRGEDGHGWMELELVLVRLNTTYTPNGAFGTYSQEVGFDGSQYVSLACISHLMY